MKDICKNCGKEVSALEIALTKKLINRASTQFLCLACLAEFFKVDEKLLLKKAEEFRKSGCALFTQSKDSK